MYSYLGAGRRALAPTGYVVRILYETRSHYREEVTLNIQTVFIVILRVVFMPGLLVALVSCGGGGGGRDAPITPAAPVVESGVFRDTTVEGLSFSSGGESGFTNGQGTFTYEVGKPVTFSVGAVEIGTVSSGQSIITPVDLVAAGAVSTQAVQNIVRFLLMLDANNDNSDGIQITQATRDELADATLDFSAADFSTQVETIAIAVRNDGMPHLVPDSASAQAHLTSTLFCARAGVFSGAFSGDDNGRLGLLVAATNGLIAGFGYSTTEDLAFGFDVSNTPVSLDQVGNFMSTTSLGTNFSGSFASPDSIEGTWGATGNSGTFTGDRLGGKIDVPFKFSGAYFGDDLGIFSFDIDEQNNVAGMAFSVVDGSTSTLSGTITGGVNNEYTLSLSNADGLQATAMINLTPGIIPVNPLAALITQGQWMNGQGESGQFLGDGCRVN